MRRILLEQAHPFSHAPPLIEEVDLECLLSLYFLVLDVPCEICKSPPFQVRLVQCHSLVRLLGVDDVLFEGIECL